MVKRKIVDIDEERCNGCGLCIPGCHEGALRIIGGKAKLVDSAFCDGLGNCIGKCPQDAIRMVERDTTSFDPERAGKHLEALEAGPEPHSPASCGHANKRLLNSGCPGAAARELPASGRPSALAQWPVQLALLPPDAPFFQDSDLLVCADCVPFACAGFHAKLLKGRSLVIGCPKLDDIGSYKEKIGELLRVNNIKSVTVAIMEVPCCHGLYAAVEAAAKESGRKVRLEKKVVSVSGNIQD